jgi:protein-S-isoprenylcysteine O-methyltransferase Ste14
LKKIAAALVGILIFAGLPVLVWLPMGLRAYAAHPVRPCFLLVATLVQIVVAVFVPGSGFARGEGPLVIARQRIVVVLLQILTLGILVVSPWTDSREIKPLPDTLRYLGICLYPAGAFLMNWSIVWLGRDFSVQVTLQPDHRLVTSGPYRIVRHPRYAGIALCFLGIALVFASSAGLLLDILLLATLIWRVRDEERLMAKAFPTEWPEYARKTARLIPYVL